jgi:hypothetical protein
MLVGANNRLLEARGVASAHVACVGTDARRYARR